MPQKTFSVRFKETGASTTARKMNRVGRSADKAGSKISTAGKVGAAALAGIATAIGGAVASMGALVSKTAQYAKEVQNAAQQSGIAQEEIQKIAYAAKQVSGASFDNVRDGLKEMSLRAAEAANGTGEAAEAFQMLGISQQEITDSTPIELFRRVRQEMQGMGAAQRQAAADMIFGGEAAEQLVGVLGLSAKEMASFRKEAEQAGAVLSEDQTANLSRARKAWNRFTTEVIGAGRQLGAKLAPFVTQKVIPALSSLSGMVSNATSFLSSLSDTAKGTIVAATGLASAISAGLAVWGAWPAIIGAVSTAFGGLATAATTAWAAITSPVTGVIAAVAAVAAAAGIIYDNWGSLSSFFSGIFDSILSLVQVWSSTMAARFHGAWLQVQQLFAQGVNSLIETINKGLRAIGAESMTIDGEVGVPSTEIEANRQRLKQLNSDLTAAQKAASQSVKADWGSAMTAIKSSVSDAYDYATGKLGALGSVFSATGQGASGSSSPKEIGTAGGGTGDSQSGGGSPGSLSADPAGLTVGQKDTQLQGMKPVEKMARVEAMRKRMMNASILSARRMGQITASAVGKMSQGIGRIIGRIFSMKQGFDSVGDAIKSFGKLFASVIKGVIKQMVAAIAKMLVFKALTSAIGGGGFLGGLIGGGGGGGVGAVSGASSMAGISIPGAANGAVVTSPTIAAVGEGGETEAIMPLSKLQGMLDTSAAGGTVTVDVKDQVLRGGDIHTSYHVSQRKQRRRGHSSR